MLLFECEKLNGCPVVTDGLSVKLQLEEWNGLNYKAYEVVNNISTRVVCEESPVLVTDVYGKTADDDYYFMGYTYGEKPVLIENSKDFFNTVLKIN